MNRTKKFMYNTMTTAILQVVTMLVGFILPKVLLKSYGSEINGLVSSITQFIAYFNLVEAGLSGAAVYALYKPLSAGDVPAINGVVSASKKFYLMAGYVFVSLTIGLALIYPMYIKTQALSPLFVSILVLVLGVNGALEFFTMAKYRVLLTADQKTYVLSAASVVQIIINTVVVVAMASAKINIVIVRAVALLSIFIRSGILLVYCKKKYKYIDYTVAPNKAALNKKGDAFFLQILGVINVGAPVLIITLVLKDLKLVSVYTIFYMVIGGINGILSIFVSGLSASFGDVIVRGQKETLQKAAQQFEVVYYIIISIIFTVALITIMPFINIYTKGITDVNYNLPLTGFLFVLNGLLFCIKTPQGMLVIAAGMYKETRYRTLTQAAITVVFGVIFSLFWGINGILVASIMSNIYRDIDLLIFIPKKLTSLPIRNSAFRVLRIFLCVSVCCLAMYFIKVVPTSWGQWFLFAGIILTVVSLVVVAINFVFDFKILKQILQRFKRG